MIDSKAELTEDSRIIIPAEYSQALGLHTNDELVVTVENGSLRIFTVNQGIKYAQDLLRPHLPKGRILSDELVAERRAEAAEE